MAGTHPWFKFFAEDWLTSELYLTTDLAVHGLFWDALALMWASSRCGISYLAIDALAKQKTLAEDLDPEADRLADLLRGEFIDHPDPAADGLVTHPKLYELWLDAENRSPQARGKLGGKKRAATAARAPDGSFLPEGGSIQRTQAKPQATQTDPDPELEPEKKEKNSPPKTGSSVSYPESFEIAWKAYGRKGSKKPALAQWKKLSASERENLPGAIKKMTRWPQGHGLNRELRFLKDFERFLRDRLFEQDPPRGVGGAADWDDPSTSQEWGDTPVFDNRD